VFRLFSPYYLLFFFHQQQIIQMAGPVRFRVYCKYLFITYPKCPAEPQYVVDYLKHILSRYQPRYLAAVREYHQDGSPHIHVLIQCHKRANINTPSKLDLLSNGDLYHPNIQAARNCDNIKDYIFKDSPSATSVAEWGEYTQSSPQDNQSRDAKMAQIMAFSTSREDYLSMVKSAFPYDWATKLPNFEYSARALHPDPAPAYQPEFSTDNLICSETLSDWATNNLNQVTPTSTVLYNTETHDSWVADFIRTPPEEN